MNFVQPIRVKSEILKVKRIFDKNKNKRDLLMFLIGINSGLRISDILKLKIEDVQNLDYIELVEQKTQKNKRFPITNSYKNLLKRFIINKNPEDWLFKSKKGNRPITRVQAYRIISRACEKAGITTKIGTHTL
jgi:integrase